MNRALSARRIPSLAGLGGAIGCLAVAAIYLRAIFQQGAVAPGGRVPFVTAWLVISALVAAVGAFSPAPGRRALLLGAATALMLTLSFPALFSIGAPLFICGVAAALGAWRAATTMHLSAFQWLAIPVLLLVGAVILLLAGFALTAG